jgi:molybdopterin synthase sulfur carrier subunit
MIVKLFGGLRQKAGGTEKMTSGSTIHEALENLCSGNAALREAIFAGDGLRPHVRVMVNGHDSELAQGLETVVTDDDEIAVFPPIAGGEPRITLT